MPRDGLGTIGTIGYAVGHVMNDMCACLWFYYLTFYL